MWKVNFLPVTHFLQQNFSSVNTDQPYIQVLEDKMEEVGAPKQENQSHMEATALSMTTLGRVSVPEDVANVVSFLSGPDSDWVTGQVRCFFHSLFSIAGYAAGTICS